MPLGFSPKSKIFRPAMGLLLLIFGVVFTVLSPAVVDAASGSPIVNPRVVQTLSASYGWSRSLTFDLDNCTDGSYEVAVDEDGNEIWDEDGNPVPAVVDEDGNIVYTDCWDYGSKIDPNGVAARTADLTLTTEIRNLPAGWGLCGVDEELVNGWMWNMFNGGYYPSEIVQPVMVYDFKTGTGLDGIAGGSGWDGGDRQFSRNIELTVPPYMSDAKGNYLMFPEWNVPLCGPDPSTPGGQSWRNLVIPVYKLPPFTKWR